MHLAKLTRQSYRQDRPGLPLLARFRLAGARAHEVCGPARRRLALWLAAETAGPVIWVRPAWHPDRLHMDGVRAEIDPGRLIFVEPDRPEDILWTTEEVLRAGIVPLVVAELPDPPGLTPVRRLHLAAEAGAAVQDGMGGAGLGLIVTPGDGGAAGVESRWRLDPAHGTHGPDDMRWRLTLLRARNEGPGVWDVVRSPGGRAALAPEQAREPA